MPGSSIRIEGIKELRRELKAIGPEWPKELRAVHKKIAEFGAARSRAVASGEGGETRHFAKSIRPRANQRQAIIAIAPAANAAFWGAKRHTGWYAKPQFHASPAQHQPWVGNSWEVAVAGQGPYAINPALAAALPQILDDYADMIDDLTKRAFPEP